MSISRSRYECRLRQSPKSGQAGSQQQEGSGLRDRQLSYWSRDQPVVYVARGLERVMDQPCRPSVDVSRIKADKESKVTVALSPHKLVPAEIPDEVVVWGTRLLWYSVEAASVPVFSPLAI